MKWGTTAVLALLAAGLVGYIVVIERKQVTTAEREERSGRLLVNFTRDQVSKIDLVRGGEHAVLAHDDKAEATKDWRMTAPVVDSADPDVMEAMLSAAEWAAPRRTFHDISEGDRKTFGLSPPRASVTFITRGSAVTLHFGGEDPRGDGVYASMDDPKTAFIVGKDVFEPFDTPVSGLRSRRVLEGLSGSVTKVSVDSTKPTVGKMAFEKRGERWWATAPFQGLASQLGVEALLTAAAEMRAERVLDAPATKGKGDTIVFTAGDKTMKLSVGGGCPEHADERVVVDDAGRSLCIKQTDLDHLFFPAEDAREDRAVLSREERVVGIRIEGGGKALVVKRDKDRWVYQLGSERGEAAPDAVGAFVRSLQFLRALHYDDASKKSKPQSTITLLLADGGKETVSLVGQDDALAWLQRGGESGTAAFPKAMAQLFAVSAVRFLSPRVLREASLDAARIERTTADGKHEIATHYDGLWTLKDAPVLDMESGAIANTVEALSNLLAEQYVSDADDGSFGLGSPSLTFEIEYRSPEEKAAAKGQAVRDGRPPVPPPDETEEEEQRVPAPTMPAALNLLPATTEGATDSAANAPPRPPVRVYTIRFGANAGDAGVYARVNDGPVFIVAKGTVARLLPLWQRPMSAR